MRKWKEIIRLVIPKRSERSFDYRVRQNGDVHWNSLTPAEDSVAGEQGVLNDTGEGEFSSIQNSPTDIERLQESTMTATDLQDHDCSSIQPRPSTSSSKCCHCCVSPDEKKSVRVAVDETIKSASAPVSNDVATWKKLSSKDPCHSCYGTSTNIPKNLPNDSKNRSWRNS